MTGKDGGKTIIATAWKNSALSTKEKEQYHLQIDIVGKPIKAESKKLKQSIAGWSLVSDGYNSSVSGFTEICVYKRIFAGKPEWTKWAKAFPYPLYVIGVKLGKKTFINEKNLAKLEKTNGGDNKESGKSETANKKQAGTEKRKRGRPSKKG